MGSDRDADARTLCEKWKDSSRQATRTWWMPTSKPTSTVFHTTRFMADIGRYIADGRVLELIGAFLKQDVLEDMTLWTPEKGSPQGAVISPLLANLYLHPVDVAMAAAGFEMIRYADDLVILCRSEAEAHRALELLGDLTTERGLTLHPVKTRLVDVSIPGEGFDFLGYHFERGTRWPRKKSLKKLKDADSLQNQA